MWIIHLEQKDHDVNAIFIVTCQLIMNSGYPLKEFIHKKNFAHSLIVRKKILIPFINEKSAHGQSLSHCQEKGLILVINYTMVRFGSIPR